MGVSLISFEGDELRDESYKRLCAWIDNGFQAPVKKHRPLKKGFIAFASIGIIVLAISAYAGLITVFLNIDINAEVNDSAIKINGFDTPFTHSPEFTERTAGDSWNESFNITNSIGATFEVNFSVSSDEGLAVVVQNEFHAEITNLTIGAFETKWIYVNYTLHPLCAPGSYNASIQMLPYQVY